MELMMSFLKRQSIKKKIKGRLETYEQQEFVTHARMIIKSKFKKLLFSIPNGGKRTEVSGSRLVAEGLTRGVPDLQLAIPVSPYHGLYIEMKRINIGKVEDDQKEMIDLLREQGYKVVVCEGSVSAMEEFIKYLKNTGFLKNELRI